MQHIVRSAAALLFASVAVAQVAIPPHASVYNGFTRGYSFTSATNFIIQQLDLPLDAYQAGDTASYMVRVNGAQAFLSRGNAGPVSPALVIAPGDVVDILGNWSPAVPGNFTAHNSYSASATNFATTIEGVPHTIQRCGWQWDIADPALGGAFLAPTTGQIGRVYMYTSPPTGLFANFSANVTSGVTPLSVNFTDASFSSDPAGITSWQWDFDGDNVIDSTLQNPTFIYTSCGTFNVSLTVTDATHPASTMTKTAYIQTDRITANFTSTVIGPLTVQFNDTSTVPATSWAWDLNGDNVTDSTAQNPVWVYASTSPVNVTLTATRLCAPPSTVTKSVVPVQQLSHNVAPNNGLSSGASVYFNVDITNPLGVAISAMDVFGSVINVPFTVDMWIKPGSHIGFEGTAAEWAKVGTASGTSASATTLPSLATFPQGIYLPSGQYGVKLQYLGTGPRYQTITAPATVTNGDLSLTVGVSRGSTIANPWAGTNINNRAWSGTLYYSTQNITGFAAYGTYGPGCAGSMGVSKLTANTPQLGSTLNVTVNNMPFNAAFMLTGFSLTTSLFGPLPFDVTIYGAPGCWGRASTEACLLLLGTGNTAVWSFAIPNDPSFQGLQMYNQAIVLDTGWNALGAVLSDAAAMLIGL